jgi:hypothetical protein
MWVERLSIAYRQVDRLVLVGLACSGPGASTGCGCFTRGSAPSSAVTQALGRAWYAVSTARSSSPDSPAPLGTRPGPRR